MEFRRRILFLPALAFLACAAQGYSKPVSAERVSCHLSGEKWAGAAEEELCEIFRIALKEIDLGLVSKIEAEARPTGTARALAFAESGVLLARLELSVMDRQLGPSSWTSLAHGLAQAIAKSKS
ncbi:hypothetical protein GRI69_10315 [Erythrobacter vulgaris]|uniref:Uncharacterized protein n=1 Tax=Qipengyuania vulgaris TaxID=291985 RepID=A0A844XRT1_9SPHN|nr:hypothetical protein [Qipengyuania vulgaris]MXO48651.1 hypothetical protein [Qipengyuania vulgaris]